MPVRSSSALTSTKAPSLVISSTTHDRRLRRYGPITAVILAVVVVLAAGAAALARGISGSSTKEAAPPVLRWANEGISDLYTLDPAQGPDFNARQAVQLIFGGLVRFGRSEEHTSE